MCFIISESVASGHPDKLADQISDAVLDSCLLKNCDARVAVETLVTSGNVVVAGEIGSVDIKDEEVVLLARSVIDDIGYRADHYCSQDLKITVLLQKQSQEIASSLLGGINAGDQGIVIGYATDETDSFIPFSTYYAHAIMKALCEIGGFGPDGKVQLNIRYCDGKPATLENLVVSIQHLESCDRDLLYGLVKRVVDELLPFKVFEDNLFVNPSGSFILGGPKSDCGLTGRKLMVDSYGSACPHGGGSFSGKDYTKVDRSGAYFARYLAKNIVASGIAKKCWLKMCYAIGKPDPLSLDVQLEGAIMGNREVERLIRSEIDCSLSSIVKMLQLKMPIYRITASYGHFGRVPDGIYFPWERLDLVPLLQHKVKEMVLSF